MRAVHINWLQWQTAIYVERLTNLHALHIVVIGSISDDTITFLICYLLNAVCMFDLFVLFSTFPECSECMRNQYNALDGYSKHMNPFANEFLICKMTAAANSKVTVLQRQQYLMMIIVEMNNNIAKKNASHTQCGTCGWSHSLLSLAFHSFHLNLSLLFCHLLNITTKFTPSEKGYIKIMYLWHAINNINSSLSSKWKVTSIKK